LVLALFGRSREHRTLPEVPTATSIADGRPRCFVDESFVYDAAARFNERLLSTIDAIDTALTAVLAGDVAVAVFTIDKIADFQLQRELAACALLSASIAACAAGYIFSFRPRGVNADGVRPRRFIADLAARHDESMIGAVEELLAAGEINVTVRSVKRILAGCAILFLLAAVIVVALARARIVMVY
jgi:hypothetical protein